MGYFLDRADPPCREPAITDRLLFAHRRSFFSVFICIQCIPIICIVVPIIKMISP